jgi:hypothetical protein
MHNNFDPRLQNALHSIITIVFVLTTFLVIVVIYLIFNKSGPIKKYRYFMLNNIVSCYIFSIAEFVARPIFLFPSFCIIFEPIIPLSTEFVIFGLYLFGIIIINMDLSAVFSVIYRYSQVSDRLYYPIYF